MRVSKQRTAVLALTMVLALGAFAPAAVAATVSYDSNLLQVTSGDNLDHDLQFRYDPASGEDNIIDSQALDGGGGCTWVVDPTWMRCPGSNNVRVDVFGGDDSVTFAQGATLDGDCFVGYVINLGNGTNDNNLNTDCTVPATLSITAGSGNDLLRGGPPGTSSTIFAGSGNDHVNPSGIDNIGNGNDVIHGGEGDDRVSGYGGNDQVYGEGGNDKLLGGTGNDIEDGGSGDDYIGFHSLSDNGENDQGADTLRGGSGYDNLHLDGHSGGMAISLDGQANDGSAGEGDNVGSDIESILGTSGTDVFRGTAGPDRFDGGAAGRDDIRGGGGDDTLIGGSGDNFLYGEAGNDQVEGRYGIDRVDGGSGRDRLFGDIDGCTGNYCDPDPGDALFARDGEADLVACGGAGTAQIDQFDLLAGRGCNSVDRQNVAAAGRLAKATFRGSRRSINVSRSGRFTYSFRAGASLRGKAAFRSVKKVRVSKRARATLARKSFKVPKSGKVKLKIKLSRKNLKILRRNRKIKTKVTVTLKNAAGLSSVASATVTLKR